jgi:hypothetical protein
MGCIGGFSLPAGRPRASQRWVPERESRHVSNPRGANSTAVMQLRQTGHKSHHDMSRLPVECVRYLGIGTADATYK